MTHILLIDDDDAVVNSVRPVLAREGYRVDHAVPDTQAIRKMLIDEPDLVILGVDPEQTGWYFCHQVLAFRESPLLLLLPSDDEQNRVRGLALGADDCIAKPIPLGEMAARVEALLRRRKSLFVDGTLEVDLAHQEVQVGDERVTLTPIEFCVLAYLIRHVDEVVSHERLVAQVWEMERHRVRDLLRPCIDQLRQKLEPDPTRPRRIVTRQSEGYMLQRIGE
jgi:DNA-binding response OmpR family regulator